MIMIYNSRNNSLASYFDTIGKEEEMPRIKNFVDTTDFTKEELLDIIDLGLLIKENLKQGYYLNVLYHKTL